MFPGMVIDVAGWILKQVAGRVVDNMTDYGMEKAGLFDATCKKCKTKQTSVKIPEGRPVSISCTSCGHIGDVYIEDLNTLTIYQVKQANIKIDHADIQIGNTSPQTFPSQSVSKSAHGRVDLENVPDLFRDNVRRVRISMERMRVGSVWMPGEPIKANDTRLGWQKWQEGKGLQARAVDRRGNNYLIYEVSHSGRGDIFVLQEFYSTALLHAIEIYGVPTMPEKTLTVAELQLPAMLRLWLE
jgi:hypothetical protein